MLWSRNFIARHGVAMAGLFTWATLAGAQAPASPRIPDDDRVRIAEAYRLAEQIGDRIWPQWSAVPFALLLVTADHEFLIRHPQPSADFAKVEYDSVLRSDVFVRERTFSPTWLASFPAVGGVVTVVVGQPKATGRSSTDWVLTVLHEHFHQLQMSQPTYARQVAALDLSGGDETGMWMLNYAFPYDSAAVQARLTTVAERLRDAIDARGGTQAMRAQALRAALVRLRTSVSARDYRYFTFQLWQEGVARYTELMVAQWASTHYTPTPAFRALSDVTEFRVAAARARAQMRKELSHIDLAKDRRVTFYPIGAAMALVLDQRAVGWRRRYFSAGYSLDPHLR
jgi:hypothetical protein